MNKLNLLGLEVIEYKKELAKDYPELVKKALYSSIENLTTNNVIDLDTLYALKDEDMYIDSFTDYIYRNEKYLKTKEELTKEYEEIRIKLNDFLETLGYKEDIYTGSSVDDESIKISKIFYMDESFLRDYFHNGINTDKLMERKGFAEMFAILRFPKIIKGFLDGYNYNKELYTCRASEVFYEKEVNAYGIYMISDINIEKLEDVEEMQRVLTDLSETFKALDEYYYERIKA